MKIGWRGALGFVLSAAFLVWTLSEVSFAQVWDVLRHSSLPLFLLSTVTATIILGVKDGLLTQLWIPAFAGMTVERIMPKYTAVW